MSDLRVDSSFVFPLSFRLTGMCGEERYEDRHAAECGTPVSFRVLLPRRIGAHDVSLTVRAETAGKLLRVPMRLSGLCGADEQYECTLDSSLCGVGLCHLFLSLGSIAGRVFSKRNRYTRFSLSKDEPDDAGSFQLLLSDFRHPAPSPVYGGIIYQIFVDRFCRGRGTPVPPGMVLHPDWESGFPEYPPYPGAPMKNNLVSGGNLDGIVSRLGYLSSLGVTMLYLTPIFESPSNHKYDTADYFRIDPLFGDDGDLKRLIEEGGKLGIRILLDGVFNHTGADSRYFNRYGRYGELGAYQSRESPFYDWYRFSDYPTKYECWWNIEILPRIHTEVPSCHDFFAGKNGVVRHYARFGIGGLRLDVADELSDRFIADIKDALTEENPDAVLYGEVWEDASDKIAYGVRRRYYHGAELDGVMNYPLRKAVIAFLRDADPDALDDYIGTVMPNMPKRVLDAQMNLIGTHDTLRALTALAGARPEGKSNDELSALRMTRGERELGRKRLKAAYLLLATMPGVPMIYYGDEAGMEGYSDPFNRMPFPWSEIDGELLSWYRRVGALRSREATYRTGRFRCLYLSRAVFLFARYDGKRCLITAVNRGDTSFTIHKMRNIRKIIGGRMTEDGLVLSPISAAVFSIGKLPREWETGIE